MNTIYLTPEELRGGEIVSDSLQFCEGFLDEIERLVTDQQSIAVNAKCREIHAQMYSKTGVQSPDLLTVVNDGTLNNYLQCSGFSFAKARAVLRGKKNDLMRGLDSAATCVIDGLFAAHERRFEEIYRRFCFALGGTFSE